MRERSKEGKSILVASLPDERAYGKFMRRFDAEDSEEVGDREHGETEEGGRLV